MLRTERVRDFSKVQDAVDIPNLNAIQRISYDRFLQGDADPHNRKGEGLEALLREIFPIVSYDEQTSLEYLYYELGQPRYNQQECRDLRLTYGLPFRLHCRLNRKDVKEVKDEAIYIGEIPIMLGGGEFIVNGAERVIVSQLHRSPGVDFSVVKEQSDRPLHGARIIPERGSWVELSVTKKDSLTIRIDQSSKIPATMFLRAMDERFGETADIIREFYKTKTISTSKLRPQMYLVEDFVDPDTGEVLVPAGGQVGEAMTAIMSAPAAKPAGDSVPRALLEKFEEARSKIAGNDWLAAHGNPPTSPGVYIFRNRNEPGKPIVYVGIATSLSQRLRSNHWAGNVKASLFRWHIWEEYVKESNDSGSKDEVAKEESGATRKITAWMKDNLECVWVPVEFDKNKDKNKKEWGQLARDMRGLGLIPKKETEDDVKLVLGYLEDRLMVEYPDKQHHPKKKPVPRFNREIPNSPSKIKKIWSRKTPGGQVEVVDKVRDPLILNTLVEDPSDRPFEKESTPRTPHERALLRLYARLRPGNPAQLEKARSLFREKFYDENRYRLGKVGRFRINRKFGQNVAESEMTLRVDDFVNTLKYLMTGQSRRADQFEKPLVEHRLLLCPQRVEPGRRPAEPAGHAQTRADAVGVGFGWPEPQAGGLRGPRRPHQPLWPHLPHRDA